MILRKIKLKLSWMWTDVRTQIGFPPKLIGKIGSVQVVVFHGICKDDEEYINGRFLKETVFGNLLVSIKENFNVISMSDFLAKKLDDTKLNVLLTFDDGYLNNKELALPICEELNIPITIFVCNRPFLWPDFFDILAKENPEFLRNLSRLFEETISFSIQEMKSWIINQSGESIAKINDYLEKEMTEEMGQNYSRFWKLLSDEDCAELSKNQLICFGNHTANHLDLTRLSNEEIDRELSGVDNRMKGNSNYNSKVFAYPYGHYSEDTISYLKENGYVQFGADGDPNSPKFLVDRLVINPYISLNNQLIAIANGKY